MVLFSFSYKKRKRHANTILASAELSWGVLHVDVTVRMCSSVLDRIRTGAYSYGIGSISVRDRQGHLDPIYHGISRQEYFDDAGDIARIRL